MSYKVGYDVAVIDQGGNYITHGKIERIRFADTPQDNEAFINACMRIGGPISPEEESWLHKEYKIGDHWYAEEQVFCAVCGDEFTCAQCGAELDLEPMTRA